MEEETISLKKLDEIYCPSCAKPIKKEAVVCPYCGMQVKELKTTASERVLTEQEEINEGIRQLSGIKVWFWFVIVVFGLGLIATPISIFTQPTNFSNTAEKIGSFFGIIIGFGFWIALFVIPLIGLIKRKPFSVPFTRAMLVITMLWFFIGTIIGAVLWKRINHPLAKKYLHYEG